MKLEVRSLIGSHVALEVLDPAHEDELILAALSAPEIFRFMPYAMQTREDLERWLQRALGRLASGTALPLVTRDRASGALAGSSTLSVTDAANRRIEIGGTWVLPRFQRTRVNAEAKYLQLCHAFDVVDALRVEFKTDARNTRSQAALERLGAVREGTLRAHTICHDGYIRDSVYFSVVAPEWPALRRALEQRLFPGPAR